MIDDQFETYSTEILRNIKNNHENWVKDKLKNEDIPKPVKIKRFKEEIPKNLMTVDFGKDLFRLASSCQAMYIDYSNDLSDDEVKLIGNFFQNIQDWVDIASEPLDVVLAAKSIDDDIKILKKYAFLIFVAVEKQRLEGGELPPSSFSSLHLSVLRKSDPRIVKIL